MDRQAWWATVYSIARVAHELAAKPPPHELMVVFFHIFLKCLLFLCSNSFLFGQWELSGF